MTNNKQQTAVNSIIAKLNNVKPTEFCSIETIKEWCEQAKEMEKNQHLMNLSPVTKKRTLIIYNTKETTEEEARHLLEILNCDDSTLWDNADHCGVQVIEVPLTYGGNK
jgi:allophanate hydrolase subunit 1